VGEVTERVEGAIRNKIASGDLAPGDRLPSERTLVADLDASRTTVRLVLMRLVAEGVIRAEHGRAYFVCEPKA
jgi:GntR family transcriptional regulator